MWFCRIDFIPRVHFYMFNNYDTLVRNDFCFMLKIDRPQSFMNLGITTIAKSINLTKSTLSAFYGSWPLLTILTLYEERLGLFGHNLNNYLLISNYSKLNIRSSNKFYSYCIKLVYLVSI